MIKRFIVALAAAALMVGGLGAVEASAGTPVNPTGVQASAADFALVCDYPAPSVNARSRVDLNNIDVVDQGWTTTITSARYRSLKTSTNTAATFTPENIQLQLYNASTIGGTHGWNAWTTLGSGSANVPADYTWSPSDKNVVNARWTEVRMRATSIGGTQCYSPSVSIS